MAAKYKPSERTWRLHYLTVIRNLDLERQSVADPMAVVEMILGRVYIEIDGDDIVNRVNTWVQKQDEQKRNVYWLFDLGKELTFGFPIDRYEDGEPIIRTYKSDTYFTPYKVIEIIENFYKEPITKEELREQQEEFDNPHAEGYTEEDADAGRIKRGALLNMFLEGFTPLEGVYYLNFGS